MQRITNDLFESIRKVSAPAQEATPAMLNEETVQEELEQTNEAQTSAAARLAKAKMSHQAKTTMKHIKPGTLKQNYGDKLDAANIKPGIKGVADRIAMLDRAKKEGRLKEDSEQVEEGAMSDMDADRKDRQYQSYMKGVRQRSAQRDSEKYADYAKNDQAKGHTAGATLYSKASKHSAKMAKEDVNFTELDEAKGLASMTIDQLKQEHEKVMNKINDQGKSKMISMNHPLSQRARSIRLHMAIKEKEGRLKEEKNKDTPGQHMCAIHVKNEQFGEGKTIPGQHAEPDDQGMIAWYDVMFEEGIIKNVPTTELEILVSEAHKNHRKMKMEELELDEARGRPRKSPAPMGGDDEDEEPDQNIVNHLKKSVDTNGNHEIKFSDGKKHKVPGHVAKKVLGAMGKLKPDDRLEIQKHIQQSHSNLMQVHGMIK